MFSLLPFTTNTYKLFISDCGNDYIYIKHNTVYLNNRKIDFPADIIYFNYPFVKTEERGYIIDKNQLFEIQREFSFEIPLKILNYKIGFQKKSFTIGDRIIKKFIEPIISIYLDKNRYDVIHIKCTNRTYSYEIFIYEKPILYYLQNKIEEDLKQVRRKLNNLNDTVDVISLCKDLELLKEKMMERDKEQYGNCHYSDIDIFNNINILEESKSSDLAEEEKFKVIKNDECQSPMPSSSLLTAYNNLKIPEPPQFKKEEKKIEERAPINLEKLEEDLNQDIDFNFTDSFEGNCEKLRLNFASLDRRRRKYKFPVILFKNKNNLLSVVKNLENIIFEKKPADKINLSENIRYFYAIIEKKCLSQPIRPFIKILREKINFYLNLNEFEICSDFSAVNIKKERKSIEDMLFKLKLDDFQKLDGKIKNDEINNEGIKNEKIKNDKIKKEVIENDKIKNEGVKKNEVIEKNEVIKNEKIKNDKIKNEGVKNEVIENEVIKKNEVIENYNVINTNQLFSHQQVISQEPVQQKISTLNKFSNKKNNLLKKLSKDN